MLRKRLDIKKFRDVTCGGAQTEHATKPQTTLSTLVVPPQLDGVTKKTDLVTVSLGANDFGLFAGFVLGNPTPDPAVMPGIRDRVKGVINAVRKKAASDVTVVLVGYPRLADPNTSCPSVSPFTEEHLTAVYESSVKLNAALKAAAEETGSIYIDMFEASKGHGICGKEPWVAGKDNEPGVAAAYHPYLAEQEAAARMIEEALD